MTFTEQNVASAFALWVSRLESQESIPFGSISDDEWAERCSEYFIELLGEVA